MAVKARAELTLASVSDGKPGSNGVGIESTAISYQAGASQTKPPTGSWSAEPPKLTTALPYLWTKTYITYTDGKTSTSYSVSSTIDGVEVGGRNLIKNSSFLKGTELWFSENCTLEYAPSEAYKGVNYLKVTQKTAGSPTGYLSRILTDVNSNFDHVPGETYTLSFIVNVLADMTLYARIDGDVHIEGGDFVLKVNKPTACKVTYKATAGGSLTFYTNSTDPWTIRNIKLEKGNKATDWTPAPEDVQQGIDDAQNSANDANNKVDNITETVTKTSAELKVLSDSISSLVTDAKGQSLMTQTGSGWTFNIGSIQSALNGAIGDIQDVKGDISGINDLANKTNQLANDVAAKTAYINMTQDESGQPVMELGQQNGEFKLRITNTSMDFMQGSQKIAYLSNRQLYIQSSVVTDEMKIGATSGYIWKKRDNGNMGLRYISS